MRGRRALSGIELFLRSWPTVVAVNPQPLAVSHCGGWDCQQRPVRGQRALFSLCPPSPDPPCLLPPPPPDPPCLLPHPPPPRPALQEVGFFDNTPTGDITSRLTADCSEMANDLTWVFRFTIEALVRIGGITGYMFLQDWRLGLVAWGIIPITALINRFYGKWLQQNAVTVQVRTAIGGGWGGAPG